MPLTSTNVVLEFLNVFDGQVINVPIPCYEVTDIILAYGDDRLIAVQGPDYSVTLDLPPGSPPPINDTAYQFILVTIHTPLITKIGAGTNIIQVARKLDLTTDFSETDAAFKNRISVEFTRTNMKLQQLDFVEGTLVEAMGSAEAAAQSAAEAAASEAAAAASAADADASANDAAADAVAADNSATAAAGSAVAADASADAAAISETNAGNSAAAALISETNAALSATAADGFATAAQLSAVAAAQSETNAAASAALIPTPTPPDAGKIVKVNAGGTGYDLQTLTGGGDMLASNNLSDLVSKPASRVNLGVEIGVNVQAQDDDLAAISAFNAEAGFPVRLGSATYAFRSLVGGAGISITIGNGVAGNPVIAAGGQLAEFVSIPTIGFITHIGPATQIATRVIGTSGFGVFVTDGDGVAGNPAVSLNALLQDMSQLGGTGILTKIAATDVVERAIAGAGLAVASNGDGVAGNPTITVTAATAANMEALNTGVAVIPQLAHRSPSAAKVWGRTIGSASPSLAASYNVTSITDGGAGDLTVTVGTDFSSANYGVVAVNIGSTPRFCCLGTSPSGAGWRCLSFNDAGSQNDPSDGHGFVAFGDHV